MATPFFHFQLISGRFDYINLDYIRIGFFGFVFVFVFVFWCLGNIFNKAHIPLFRRWFRLVWIQLAKSWFEQCGSASRDFGLIWIHQLGLYKDVFDVLVTSSTKFIFRYFVDDFDWFGYDRPKSGVQQCGSAPWANWTWKACSSRSARRITSCTACSTFLRIPGGKWGRGTRRMEPTCLTWLSSETWPERRSGPCTTNLVRLSWPHEQEMAWQALTPIARRSGSGHRVNQDSGSQLPGESGTALHHQRYPMCCGTSSITLSIIHSMLNAINDCMNNTAPKMFTMLFTLVKPLLSQATIDKFHIYGTDEKEWRAALLEYIDADQLPVYYGGTMTDPDGDPKCSSRVRRSIFYWALLSGFLLNWAELSQMEPIDVCAD